MEKTETNQQLKLLLQIAKELIQEGKSNSFRDFSSKYLNTPVIGAREDSKEDRGIRALYRGIWQSRSRTNNIE